MSGIDSDRGVWVEADGRYLDYSGTAHDEVGEILARYEIEPRILFEVDTYLVPRVEDDNGVQRWWSDRATVLTDDLADALRLDPGDRQAAADGAVLVNTAAVGYVGQVPPIESSTTCGSAQEYRSANRQHFPVSAVARS